MKLDNVDLSKLQLDNLPKFDKCPCELCDDGCFDRAGYKHHPECRRNAALKRTQLSRAARCPLTHYQSTFLAATGPRGKGEDHRRSICPPPPDNEIPISFPNEPMSGLSSQRNDFQPPPPGAIQKKPNAVAKQVDNLVIKRMVPMETKTQYQVEYVEKPVIPVSLRPLKDPTKDSNVHLTDPLASVSSQTTARADFKPWQSAPSHPFAELPSIAGHVLFPSLNRSFSTSSGTSFIPFPNAPRAKPVFRPENSGALKVAGSMDLRTNYRQDFIPHEPTSARSTPSDRKKKFKEEQVYFRRPMNEISQATYDFRAYPEHRPPPPAEMGTFLSQIKIGSPSKETTNKSQYRLDYEGIDTSRYLRQPLAGPKDHNRTYVAPLQKMDTMTVTQRDFQPLDIKSLPRMRLVPLKNNLTVNDQYGPMESVSMSRYHFQPYEGVKTKRYGDPVPNLYIPSFQKFDGRTTNNETYLGQPGPRAHPYVPEIPTLRTVGKQDHNTNYRLDYHPHGLSLCAARAYAIAQQKQKPTTPISAQ